MKKKEFEKLIAERKQRQKEMVAAAWNATKQESYPPFDELPETFQQELIRKSVTALATGTASGDVENYVIQNYVEPS